MVDLRFLGLSDANLGSNLRFYVCPERKLFTVSTNLSIGVLPSLMVDFLLIRLLSLFFLFPLLKPGELIDSSIEDLTDPDPYESLKSFSLDLFDSCYLNAISTFYCPGSPPF